MKTPIDPSNVLLLSHLSNFRDGTILVREQQGLRFDIFRSYTSANDTVGAIRALRKYGPEEPQLYPAALAYFTSSPRILEEAGDELDVVLRKIDHDGLMAPLQVIQTLSTNAVATMGMVKKYLSDTIERERKEISNVRFLFICCISSALGLCPIFSISLVDQEKSFRTAASRNPTEPKPRPNARNSLHSAAVRQCSKRVDAPLAAKRWICRRCIFSVNTASTNAA